MPDFSNGSEFAGHRIERKVKRGGMGVVYQATDLRLKRVVALKVIAPELTREGDFRIRFNRESELAAGIDHPNVIPIYHSGEEDGVLFTTMRWVEGPDLGDLLAERGRLSPEEAMDIISQVARGLDAAHATGLVHRDVKPGNILLTPDRDGFHAYLTDFGLTKRVAGRTELTTAGMFVGTVDYVAPEQLKGESVDGRADVYSLGCVLFHTLTGEVPYTGSSDWSKLRAHDEAEVPKAAERVKGLSPSVDGVIDRAMAKRPEDRFSSAGDLGEAALASLDPDAAPPAEKGPVEAAPVAQDADAGPTEIVSAKTVRPAEPGAPGAAPPLAGPPGGTPPAPPPEGPGRETPRQRRPVWQYIVPAAALAVVAILAVVLLGGGDGSDQAVADIPDNAVATVDGNPISTKRFDHALDQAAAHLELSGTPAPGTKDYKAASAEAFDDLLDQAWTEGEAAAKQIPVSEAEVTKRLDAFKAENFEGPKQFQAYLRANSMTPADERERIRLQIINRKIKQRVCASGEPFDQYVGQFQARWRALTVCRPAVRSGRCSNGPKLEATPPTSGC